MGGSNITLYEMFFEMQMVLTDRFPSLSPFDLRKESAYEVFLLIRRLNNYSAHKDKPRSVRKQAGDDWF